MRDIQSEIDLGVAAYEQQRFDDALEIFERIVAEPHHDVSSHYMLGCIYETGGSSRGVDLEKALACYRVIDGESETLGSIGAVACARVLSRKNRCANQPLIEAYCKRAIELDGSTAASFLLARMYEECQGNHRLARKHYLRMFRHSRPVGLRYYAASHIAHGNKVIGVLAHIATTLVAPFFFVINRGRTDPEFDPVRSSGSKEDRGQV